MRVAATALPLVLYSAVAPADVLGQDGFEAACQRVAFSESFATDGAAWPAPWSVRGGVAVADVVAGRGRVRPVSSSYTVGRLWAPVATRDVEVRFTFEMEQTNSQGLALLVRHNGGYLTQSQPVGQGYGVFLEGSFRNLPGISLWKEDAGVESQLAHSPPSVSGPIVGVRYRVRYRVHQLNATTTAMQAKFWPIDSAEPLAWQVSVLDSTAELQNRIGGVGFDSASGLTTPVPVTAHAFLDDLQIEPLCNPILGLSASLVAEGFQFTEGPLWRDNHLLFTDLPTSTIHRLDPPATISVFRSPSGQANGLALQADGALLAAEGQARRVSITGSDGIPTTLVERYQGARLNSPNDLAIRSDGTLYFTDPDYGLVANPPVLRELPHHGLYRRTPAGALVLEWAGGIGVNQPNGVQLALDESWLFVTDTQQGQLRRWAVAADGSLSDPQVLASGLNIPDGMCLDDTGNLYVSVAAGVELFTADGARWGLLPVPRMSSNCGFGDADGHTLYITARQGLYRARLP